MTLPNKNMSLIRPTGSKTMRFEMICILCRTQCSGTDQLTTRQSQVNVILLLLIRLIDTPLCQLKPVLIRAASVTLPVDTKNVGQYEAVFLQLADEHRTVNAFELHELLEACLPNDYIKSCANLDVCRQVILAFDVSALGRLKLSDFRDFMASLKQWQGAFKSHTKEKTGILRAERFKDALFDVGFQVNNDVLFALMLRHMRKDGTLRFGDFVSAVLHLAVAFGNLFKFHANFIQISPVSN